MKDINGQLSSVEILEQRKKEGIVKEFPLKCTPGLVLRVKLPSPKDMEAYMRSVVLKQNVKTKEHGEKSLSLEEGFAVQDYYLKVFEDGLQDGWTLDMLKPEEFAEVKANIMDFFGQTPPKDGTASQTTPVGQTE